MPLPQRNLRLDVVVVAGLLTVAFIAYFWRFSEFGFYSDEHAYFGGLINRSWPEEWRDFLFAVTKWPQGRPLGIGFNLSLLPYAIFRVSGLPGLFLFAFLIRGANTALLYALVSKRLGRIAGFFGAGFYALAPADTVQLSLVFSYNFEIAVLFGLIATKAALAGRRGLFILGTGVTLLMVEPMAMVTLFVPLFLTFGLDRNYWKKAFGHISIWTTLVAGILLARRVIGDPWGGERVGEIAAAPVVTATRGVVAAFTGFKTHLGLAAERILQPYGEADAQIWCVIIVVSAFAFGAALIIKKHQAAAAIGPVAEEGVTTLLGRTLPSLRVIFAGVATMLSVYFCYFRDPWYPAAWGTGFQSGVHVIAATGSCLVFCGLLSLLLVVLPARAFGGIVFVFAAALGSLGGFGQIVQSDYANSWSFQKRFWQAYVRLCPDATDGTFILILDRNLPHPRYSHPLFSWGTEILPAALFAYWETPMPTDPVSQHSSPTGAYHLTQPPCVLMTASNPADTIEYKNGSFAWKWNANYFMLPKSARQQPVSGNVILLVYENGDWRRIRGELNIDGEKFMLRAGGQNVIDRIRKNALSRVFEIR